VIDWQAILDELEVAEKVDQFDGQIVQSRPNLKPTAYWAWRIKLKGVWSTGSAVFQNDRPRAFEKAKAYVKERLELLTEVRSKFGPNPETSFPIFAKIWEAGFDAAMQQERGDCSLAQDNPFE
jgi:hypothetical protein